jgi:hypothetical protein
MEDTEMEKELLGIFRELQGEKARKDLVFQAEVILRAQEALKEDLAGKAASGDKPAA